jgi:enamine deaminase RidA (YjgF/YER057c/UK114 family)
VAPASPEDRLRDLGLELPVLSTPRGAYVRARRHGSTLYLAGHGPPPDADGHRPHGKIGTDLTLEAGYAAARGAGLALLATLAAELGALSRVAAVLRIFGMVNVAPGFDATPKVIDGCSDLLLEVFGPEIGRHARSAVGVAELPFGLPVEIEAVVAIRDEPRRSIPA